MDSNIGISGKESIRLNGVKIENLPIRESVISAQQMKLVEDDERKDKIRLILHTYPKPKVAYLNSRISECEDNIAKQTAVRGESEKLISEYTGIITLCEFRDKELEGASKQQAAKLNLKYPPYNVKAMNKQIEQSRESISRIEEVIKKEYDSIVELKEVLGKCIERDIKLKALGVEIAAA